MDEIIHNVKPTGSTLDDIIDSIRSEPNEVWVVGDRVVLMSPELYEKLKAKLNT